MLVLLVDDQAELRELAQTVLEDAGMTVISASDGARALRLLERVTPDVIVTDMMMPVLDGFGFLERYRTRDVRAPVLAVSSFRGYLERAKESGADAVLPKPYGPRELVEAVRSVARAHAGADASGEHPAEPSRTDSLVSHDEASRVHALAYLGLDGPAPEQRLHDFTREVAAHFEVPICLANVVATEDAWWTAGCGLGESREGHASPQSRREVFCSHAVAARSALVVQDCSANPYFRDNPLVEKKGFRFYAGVPLVSRHGVALGTLCLLDRRARTFTHSDLELLSLFGQRVLCALEWREKRRASDIPDSTLNHLHFYEDAIGVYGKAAFESLAVVEAARAAEQRHRLSCVALAVPYRRLAAIAEALVSRPKTIVGRLGHARLGWLVPRSSASEARQVAIDIAGAHAFVEASPLERYAGGVPAVLDGLEARLGNAGLA